MITPPRNNMTIIHKIRILHKNIYVLGRKINKADKLGIHAEIEKRCINILSLAIKAIYKPGRSKNIYLEELRIDIDILKNLIRTENELGIINVDDYIKVSEQSVEISKMTNGWINYITQKGFNSPL